VAAGCSGLLLAPVIRFRVGTPYVVPTRSPLHTMTEPEATDEIVDQFARIASTLIADWPRYFPMLAQSEAVHPLRAFKAELRSRAFAEFCVDYANKSVCGDNSLRVDYYIGTTIVQIAMDLRNLNGEFEQGILRAIMAQAACHKVTRLVFFAKSGARARCNTPPRKALIAWAEMEHGLQIEIREFGITAECILDTTEDRA